MRVPTPSDISGRMCVRILCNRFGFKAVRQRGSHVVLRKETPHGRIGTVVPLHPQLKHGTLRGILELAKVDEEEFMQYV
jgi:predicted RNA binding protein YcfA (HicA-like mRNA interferase family)